MSKYFDSKLMDKIVLTDNSELIKKAEKQAISRSLYAIGLHWKNVVQGIIQDKDIIDKGDLKRSMKFDVNSGKSEINVGSDVEHSGFNELGTRKMKARPFLRPSILDHIKEYEKIVKNELEKG